MFALHVLDKKAVTLAQLFIRLFMKDAFQRVQNGFVILAKVPPFHVK